MSKYLDHLTQMSTEQTLSRKVEYFRYNIGSFLNNLNFKKVKVLEIGPGLGEFESFLNKNKIYDIDIIDNDNSILDYVSGKYKVKNNFLSNDLSKIEKKLRNYDLIFLMQVFEHIPVASFEFVMRILFAHLNKNGYLIIIVPNANNPLGLIERYADLQHTNAFTTQSLKDLVNLANLKNCQIEIKGFEIPNTGIINIMRKILQKVLHFFLLLLMIINGGLFFKVMTPNIMLVVKKK